MNSKYTQLSDTVWVRDIEEGKERFSVKAFIKGLDPNPEPEVLRSRCRIELTGKKLDVHAEYPYRDVVPYGRAEDAWEYPALVKLPRYSGRKSDGSRGSIEHIEEYLGTLPVRAEVQGDVAGLSARAREQLFDKAYKHFCLSSFRSRVFLWEYLLKRRVLPYLYRGLSLLTGLSNEDLSMQDKIAEAKEHMFGNRSKSVEFITKKKGHPRQGESGPFSLSPPAMLTLALIYGLLWVREAPPYTLSAVFFSRDDKGVPLPLDTTWLILAGLLHILLGNRVVTLLFRGLNPSGTLHITLKV